MREVIKRYHTARKQSPVNLAPPAVYCLLTQERVEVLEKDFEDIKKTLRGIWVSVFLVLVGLIIDIVIIRTGVLSGGP